jgi:hypothetical protein
MVTTSLLVPTASTTSTSTAASTGIAPTLTSRLWSILLLLSFSVLFFGSF